MKWLLTRAGDGDRFANYLRWLASNSLETVAVGSLAERPSCLEGFDALLLTGGGDVNPARYGAPRHPATGSLRDERDALELALIDAFLGLGKPVLGICRGIQILAVALGGKLIQHVPDALAAGGRTPEIHQQRPGVSGDAEHGLVFCGDSRLRAELDGVVSVNSAHHQAVDPASVGPRLRVTATSPSGMIEAVEGRDLPSAVLAVQWHPERMPPECFAAANLLRLMKALC